MFTKRHANVRFGLTKAVATIAFVLTYGLAHAADSMDSLPAEVQVSILMKQITNAISEGDYKSALPAFRKIQGMNQPLPESFDFYYIEALARTNTDETVLEANERIQRYFSKYGKKGGHYQEVVEHSVQVMPRVEAIQRKIEAERMAAIAREKEKSAQAERYKQAMMVYESDLAKYKQWESDVLPGRISSCKVDREQFFKECYAIADKKDGFWGSAVKAQEQREFCGRHRWPSDCEEDVRKDSGWKPPVRPVE